MPRGKFIVLDGMDGSGKGTQIALLKELFKSEQVTFTREPWGIRDALFSDFGEQAEIFTQLLLHFGDKNEHMRRVVIPALKEGRHVISDRGISATWAFQVALSEEGDRLKSLFKQLAERVYHGKEFFPDLFLFLDLAPEIARERALRDTKRKTNHYDVKPVEYYQQIRDGYQNFADEGHSVKFVDADGTPEEVQQRILEILHEVLPSIASKK